MNAKNEIIKKLLATSEYIEILETEIAIEKEPLKLEALERKIAREYGYKSGLTHALQIMHHDKNTK